MFEQDAIQLTILLLVSIMFILVVFLIWLWFPKKKEPEPEQEPIKMKRAKGDSIEEQREWRKGKHFGSVFWNPVLNCKCVVVKVEGREDWYYITEREPETVIKADFPITRIAGDLK